MHCSSIESCNWVVASQVKGKYTCGATNLIFPFVAEQHYGGGGKIMMFPEKVVYLFFDLVQLLFIKICI